MKRVSSNVIAEAKPSGQVVGANLITPQSTQNIVLWLPFPVTTNRMNSLGRGHLYQSSEHKTWISEAYVAFLQQKPSLQPFKRIEGKFKAHIILDEKKFTVQDVDNSKCILDFLQKVANVIRNDKYCFDYHITWGQVEGGGCVIHVVEIPNA